MKLRGLLIAVLILLVLSGLLFWSNRRKQAEEIALPSSTPSPAILSLNQDAVSQLAVMRTGSAPVTLVKGDSGVWRIAQPQPFNADQDAVKVMLSTLANLSGDRIVEDKASDLKPYGLDQPSVEVDITTKDGKEQKLLLGDDTPAGGDVYARVAGDPRVFTLASFKKASIDKGLNDLRDKRLLTLAPDKISRVDLTSKGQTVEFGRTSDSWQILKPQPLRADRYAVDDLVRTVSNARMDLSESGAGQEAALFAQAPPMAAITLTGDQGAQTLEVRKNKDAYYAKSSTSDGIYKVDAALGQVLEKSFGDFRDKSLFDFGEDDPQKIELHNGAQAWFFLHSGSDWWSNGKKMDSSGVESLVEKLRDLAATGFPDSGFTAADLQVMVTSADGKQVQKVLFSKSGNDYIARRDGESSLYQLSSSAVSDLLAAAGAVKPASQPAK